MYSLRHFARMSLSAAKPAMARSGAANSFVRSARVQLAPSAARSFSLSRVLLEDKSSSAVSEEKSAVVEDAASLEQVLGGSDAKGDVRAASEPVQPSSEEAIQTQESFVEAQAEPASEDAAAADVQARTVFVGGVSWNVDNEWLRDEVLKALEVGPDGVNGVRIARNPMGKSKGFGFVELSSAALAQQLAAIEGLEVDGRTLNIQISSTRPTASGQVRPPRPERERPTGARNAPYHTIWLGNVAWSVNENLIEEAFAEFGQVKRVHMPLDSVSGKSRGIAYVEYETVAEATKAVEAGYVGQGIVLDARPVRLDFAQARTEGGKRPYQGTGEKRDRHPRGGERGGRGERGGYGSRRDGNGGGFNRRPREAREPREEW